MKWFGFGTAVVVAALTLAGAPVFAQEGREKSGAQGTTPRSGASQQTTRADTQGFVNDMAIAGLAEVQLGKMATERAANDEVKAFGQMMVKDHSKANDELKQVASQLKIQPTMQLDQKHKDLVDKLSKLQGAEFDREYMNAMVQGHQEVLGKLRARVDAKVPAAGAAGGTTTGATGGTTSGAAGGTTTGATGGAAAGGRSAGEHQAGEHPAGAGSRDRDTGRTTSTQGAAGAGTTGGDGEAQLTQWAAKTMPAVQMHLDRARELQKKVAK